MVLLPHGRDQADNAVRVTARGAGVALKRSAEPSAIAAAVRRDAASDALVRELEGISGESRVDAWRVS
jgi:UDP:flavonoid glycosyltransferase YjiC (YdhE family)